MQTLWSAVFPLNLLLPLWRLVEVSEILIQ
jgi:hypothetical protein